MKKLLASASVLVAAGLAFPALAQVSSDESVGTFEPPSSVAATMEAASGATSTDTSVLDYDDSSTTSVDDAAANADADVSASVSTDDGDSTVPSELPNTGGGGMAR